MRGHGCTYDTMCGAFTTIVVYICLFIFIITRLSNIGTVNNNEYSFFGNLLPEIAGVIVCGNWLVSLLVHPINQINYNIELIENLFISKSKNVNEVPIPKDTVLCPKFSCTCCCGVESEEDDKLKESKSE